MADRVLTTAEIQPLLEDWLEAEFNLYPMEALVIEIAALAYSDQVFMLEWVKRTASANVQIGHLFAIQAPRILTRMNHRSVEAWALHALDEFDRVGIKAALDTLRDHSRFVSAGREHAVGVVYHDIDGVLRNFVHGLPGRMLKLERRALKLEQGTSEPGAYTDSETLFLPAVIAELDAAQDNFMLAKVMVTMLWAQTRFGTFRCDIAAACSFYPDSASALACFQALENLRLEAVIDDELPGIGREMRRLRKLVQADELPLAWLAWRERLGKHGATVGDTLACLEQAYAATLPPAPPYQCALYPDIVAAALASRIAREKMLLRVKLAELLDDEPPPAAAEEHKPRIELHSTATTPNELPHNELVLDGNSVPLPDAVSQLLTSIQLDFGDIPPEYLEAAGPGEYDPDLYQPSGKDPDDVWSGIYHEEGATFYPEWDYRREHYRKNWCVMREIDVEPVYDSYRLQVIHRYPALSRQLRRSFEALRDQNRLNKRQIEGDDLDIDALVEAWGDAHAGGEISERLYTQRHRADRDIAVLLLVDMSGSTQGWINDIERESLLLLSEALEALGDRYAIYGFSGMARKKCELYRIKQFAEEYGPDVQARISGIRTKDYTRMGFAIRHATRLLGEVEARTRLLITLSDGQPDDYTDNYRGRYGIEDTRRALLEATRSGIRPFCITVDREGRGYLPHLYGSAHYTVVDDVSSLPYRISDIYRRLTH
jgi:nitric oxide reductase NorD protein